MRLKQYGCDTVGYLEKTCMLACLLIAQLSCLAYILADGLILSFPGYNINKEGTKNLIFGFTFCLMLSAYIDILL